MSYSSRRGGGPPTWFVFLVGVAFVFGVYYLYSGARNFFESGGLSIMRATQEAQRQSTATVESLLDISSELPTQRPTSTPIPECQTFIVNVPSAIVRQQPSTNSRIVETFDNGTEICVIAQEAGTDWYLIDVNPITRRIDVGYMRNDLMVPLNPTPTPSNTPPPLPTITPTPTPTRTPTPPPTDTPTEGPSPTPNETESATPTQSPTPTETPNSVSI